MNGRSWGKINMRHPFAIAAWKNHICTDGHKDGMVAREARDLRLALGDDVRKPRDQLALGSFFTAKGKGSRFDRPVQKKQKRQKLVGSATETSSRKTIEGTGLATDAPWTSAGTAGRAASVVAIQSSEAARSCSATAKGATKM